MNWRVAKSLLKLRDQVNAAYPGRAKGWDGTIGDASHASRSSDHNPWVHDSHGQPVVTAMDITHDPRSGFDSYKFADMLLQKRDPRIKYVISNRRIGASHVDPDWEWRPYHGVNPHDHHVHISVSADQHLYDDERDWDIGPVAQPDNSNPPKEDKPVLRLGNHGDDVRALQRMLGIADDGDFGAATNEAVKKFQHDQNLVPDGVVGGYTWAALRRAAS